MAANHIGFAPPAQISTKHHGCTLKAYKKDIINNIPLYGEMHRFIRAYAASRGVNRRGAADFVAPRQTGAPNTKISYI